MDCSGLLSVEVPAIVLKDGRGSGADVLVAGGAGVEGKAMASSDTPERGWMVLSLFGTAMIVRERGNATDEAGMLRVVTSRVAFPPTICGVAMGRGPSPVVGGILGAAVLAEEVRVDGGMVRGTVSCIVKPGGNVEFVVCTALGVCIFLHSDVSIQPRPSNKTSYSIVIGLRAKKARGTANEV